MCWHHHWIQDSANMVSNLEIIHPLNSWYNFSTLFTTNTEFCLRASGRTAPTTFRNIFEMPDIADTADESVPSVLWQEWGNVRRKLTYGSSARLSQSFPQPFRLPGYIPDSLPELAADLVSEDETGSKIMQHSLPTELCKGRRCWHDQSQNRLNIILIVQVHLICYF